MPDAQTAGLLQTAKQAQFSFSGYEILMEFCFSAVGILPAQGCREDVGLGPREAREPRAAAVQLWRGVPNVAPDAPLRRIRESRIVTELLVCDITLSRGIYLVGNTSWIMSLSTDFFLPIIRMDSWPVAVGATSFWAAPARSLHCIKCAALWNFCSQQLRDVGQRHSSDDA